MNRTAQCIRMLSLLKTHKRLTKNELAERLETSPSNIREYKKELEAAGYEIDTRCGRYGSGYSLASKAVLPSLSLKQPEFEALVSLIDYLEHSSDFLQSKTAAVVIDQVLLACSASMAQQTDVLHYAGLAGVQIPQEQQKMILDAQNAVKTCHRIRIYYQARESEMKLHRTVDPYAVFGYGKKWYVIGYDSIKREIRMFRFSPWRMFSLEVLPETFLKDESFDLNAWRGKTAARKEKTIQYTVQVKPSLRRLFLEEEWGDHLEAAGENEDGLIYTFESDCKMKVFELLFRYAQGIRILAPDTQKEEFRECLRAALKGCAE